jgi:hypothetical protein
VTGLAGVVTVAGAVAPEPATAARRGAAFCASSVLHAWQRGHRPAHLIDSAPHSLQRKPPSARDRPDAPLPAARLLADPLADALPLEPTTAMPLTVAVGSDMSGRRRVGRCRKHARPARLAGALTARRQTWPARVGARGWRWS